MNNTEITSLSWYSADVEIVDAAASATDGTVHREDGGWNEATPWPLIQGTDCCGIVDELGQGVDPALLVRDRPSVHAPEGCLTMHNAWMASDFDGAFAEYVKVPASEVFPVVRDWTHAELVRFRAPTPPPRT